MAELPRVPFPSSTTQPIRYNLSAGDIAGPYTAIAQASKDLGGAAEAVSVPLAEQAAAQSVRRDDSGNLIVDKLPPLVGDAATQARLTIAAKLQPQIETDLLKQKLDNPNDPVGFMKSVSAYKPGLLKGMDGQLSVGVGRMVDNTSQQYLRSLMVEKDANDTAEFKQSMETQLTRINDQTQVLARQAGGVESKEYSQLYQERVTLINALKNNPKIKLTDDKARLLLDEAHGNDMGQSIIGSTVRQFQTTKNKAAAQKYLMDWAWGEPGKDLPLTPRQRDHFVTEGLRSLEGMSAEDSKAITESKRNIAGAINAWMPNPGAFREAPYHDLMAAATAVGDDEGARNLRAFYNWKDVFADLSSQNSEDRARKIDLIQHLVEGTRPGAPPDEAFTNAPGRPVAVDFSDAATAHMWDQAVTRGRALAATDAQKAHDDLKYSIEHNHPISEAQVKEFGQLAILGRKEDLVDELRPGLAAAVARGQIPPEVSNAVVSQAKQAANQTTDPVAQKYADALVKQTEADEAEKKKSPLQYAVDHYGADSLSPLVPDKPDAFRGAIAQRGPTAAKFHEIDKTFGGASWVNEAEGDQLYSQLTQTLKPEDAAAAVQTLGSIPDTNRDRLATLTQPKVMSAIRDMGYSMDPQRLVASMQVQEDLRNTHPHEYTQAYGKEADRHLDTYLALQGAFNSAQIAEMMNKPVEGRTREARNTIEEDTKKGMSTWTPEDVAYKMGTAWWTTPGPVARAMGTTPRVPADPATASAFLSEFKEGVGVLVGRGADPGKAQTQIAQSMAREWAVSGVNGGTLMKYAPELYANNPPLPGDPQGIWLRRQLDEHITSIKGPQMPEMVGAPPSQAGPLQFGTPNWRFNRLVSDAQSKYEAEHGQRVTYPIWITDKNGQDELLKDKDGNTRFGFDAMHITNQLQTGAPYGLESPAAQAFAAKQIELQKAEEARARQIETFGGNDTGPPLIPLGAGIRSALGSWGIRNVGQRMRNMLGIGPPLDHKAHAEYRDGGQ